MRCHAASMTLISANVCTKSPTVLQKSPLNLGYACLRLYAGASTPTIAHRLTVPRGDVAFAPAGGPGIAAGVKPATHLRPLAASIGQTVVGELLKWALLANPYVQTQKRRPKSPSSHTKAVFSRFEMTASLPAGWCQAVRK